MKKQKGPLLEAYEQAALNTAQKNPDVLCGLDVNRVRIDSIPRSYHIWLARRACQVPKLGLIEFCLALGIGFVLGAIFIAVVYAF